MICFGGDNSNSLWNVVSIQGFLGRYFCTWSTTSISGIRPSGNEWPSWSDMAKIVKLCTIKYGACTVLGQIYINISLLYTTSHIFPVLPIKHLGNENGEPTTPHKLATEKTFSIKPTCFILSMCFMKSNYTCWHKGVKYAS